MSEDSQSNQIHPSQPFQNAVQEVGQTPQQAEALRERVTNLEMKVEQLEIELREQVTQLQQQPQSQTNPEFEQRITRELQQLKSQQTDRKWQWQIIAVLVVSGVIFTYYKTDQLEHTLSQQDVTTKAAVEDRISKLEDTMTELVKELSAGRAANRPITISESEEPPKFTMTRFGIHKTEASRWTSKPVYSDHQGYKLCLGVIASGTGFGKGTHISVFVHFMRGHFDDSLKWPFRGVIRFRLLDQQSGEDHKAGSVVYDDNVADSVCTRVTEGEVGKGKWGYVEFILHSELEPKYLVNDTLVFQIFDVELH